MAEQVIALHGNEMLRVARRYSATAADAEDAYQRAFEVLLTKAPSDDAARLLPWLITVTRNEALMIRRKVSKIAAGDFDRIMASAVGEIGDSDERLVEGERLGHGREVLRRLKPDQVRCLLLRADGLGYPEICELTGFSYAKVNRLLSHGRKAFQEGVGRLDRGDECERLSGTLSLIADDEAQPAQLADAELHLEHCRSCRLTLQAYRLAPSKTAALLPVNLAAGDDERVRSALGRLADWAQSVWAWMHDRFAGAVGTLHQGADLSVAGKLGVAAAVAVMGVPAVELAVQPHGPGGGARSAATHDAIAPAGFSAPAGATANALRAVAASAATESASAAKRAAAKRGAAKRAAARRAARLGSQARAATAAQIAGTGGSPPVIKPDSAPASAQAPAATATVAADPADTPGGTKTGNRGAQEAGFAP